MTWIWPHFKPNEVLSPDGLMMLEKGIVLIQPVAMDFLEAFRVELDRPIIINNAPSLRRGYRSVAENQQVGGERFSFHLQGLAFDCTALGMTPQELAERAEAFGWHGVGLYRARKFVHMDLRGRTECQQFKWVCNT